MNLLQDHRIVTLGEKTESALARFLTSLGARIETSTEERLLLDLQGASFLLDRRQARHPPQPDLEARFPELIHVCVSPFGHSGPRADWSGSELAVAALGGALELTGDPDRPPVKEALDACLFHTDMVAASAALAAHFERGESKRGQTVEICAQQVTFSRAVNPILVWQFDRRKLHRTGGALGYGRATVRCIWPLADGWCFHTLMTGRLGAPANKALSDWMDEKGVHNPLRETDWLRYDRSSLDPATRARWEDAIGAFFRTCSKSDIAVEGRRRGINATVVCEPRDALRDAHLEARGFWVRRGPLKAPGRFFRTVDGEPADAPAPARRAGRPGPLSGVRVLDFSWALVGSITTKVLGDLGAEVIKVESRTRPCLSRLDRQVAASSADSLDDKPWFAHLNTSKRSLALDLKIPESREVLDPLVRWADLVVENFSPGTMDKLGLGYPALSRLNPGIILVSGSVYGQTGPLAREWGVDGTGGALSGRTYLTGWPDRDPVIPSALPYGDVIVPYVMAAARTSTQRCTKSACSRCTTPCCRRKPARHRRAPGMAMRAGFIRPCIPRSEKTAGSQSAVRIDPSGRASALSRASRPVSLRPWPARSAPGPPRRGRPTLPVGCSRKASRRRPSRTSRISWKKTLPLPRKALSSSSTTRCSARSPICAHR